MRNDMSLIKIILLNVLIIFSLLGMLLLATPTAYFVYKIVKGHLFADDSRSEFALYEQFSWAKKHFKEFNELPTTYYDYITWRRDDYIGETINITDGLRKTVVPHNVSNDTDTFWFFGGSTTWGTGVSDSLTYPSLFAAKKNTNVVNFGESGYIARQSLAYMTSHLITNNVQDLSDTQVVFYDGVNDVALRCRSENDLLGSGEEFEIQLRLKLGSQYSFKRVFSQLSYVLDRVVRKLGGSWRSESYYNCSNNIERATEVAETLVGTWQAASNLVERQGGKFTAILQPVAFYTSSEYGYLDLSTAEDTALRQQYEAVYPLIIEAAKKSSFNFLDLTRIYDDCGDCYIDYCHVGPRGYELLVQSLTDFLD